jgi:hypothetical protein
MKLIREALESTIQNTPFNTFSNVMRYDGQTPPSQLGGDCTHWLRVMEQNTGAGQLRFVKSAGPHFAAIADNSEGIMLVDPTTLMVKPLDIGPVLKDPRAHASVDAYPFTNGKPSRITAFRSNTVTPGNRLTVIKEVQDGNRYIQEAKWEYTDIQAEDQLPPEAYIDQMTLKHGTIALTVLLPNRSLLKIKQKVGEREKMTSIHGGKRPFTQFRQSEPESKFREVVELIAERCGLRSRIIMDNITAATAIYPKFTLPT